MQSKLRFLSLRASTYHLANSYRLHSPSIFAALKKYGLDLPDLSVKFPNWSDSDSNAKFKNDF